MEACIHASQGLVLADVCSCVHILYKKYIILCLEALSCEAESVAAALHHAEAGTHQLDAPSCKESIEAGPQDALSSIPCDHDIKPAALTIGQQSQLHAS